LRFGTALALRMTTRSFPVLVACMLGGLSFGTLACEGSGGAPGSAGTTGTGGGGSGGTGSGGGGTGGGNACRTAEELRPGQCDPTFAQQVQREATRTCNAGGIPKVYTGDCGGHRVWYLAYPPGDSVWCLYDTSGRFVGEAICGSFITSCNGFETNCAYSGTTPAALPTTTSCPAGALTSACDSADAGSNGG